LEHIPDLPRQPRVIHNDADLAPSIKLYLAETLATNEGRRTIANDHSYVEPQIRQPTGFDTGRALSELAKHANLDSGFRAIRQLAQHQPIAHLGVVDQQFFFCFLDEPGEDLARALWTDDQVVVPGIIRLPRAVRLEQRARLLHEPGIVGHDAEAAALLDI